MSAERYSRYLPDVVRELQEFQKMAEFEGPILEEEAAAKEEMIRNQWILTAERRGLLRLARMMGFSGAEAMETEPLREEILYRWNNQSPYTYFHLLDWLDGYCGAGEYKAKLERESYLLHLVLELRIKEKRDFLLRHLRKMIPANLMLKIDLNTNTHGKIGVMTHGQMKALSWRYGEIPFEDLKPYHREEAQKAE